MVGNALGQVPRDDASFLLSAVALSNRKHEIP